MYEYMGEVWRVIDGDTIVALVDLGFRVHAEVRLRLLFCFAPELKKRKRDADGDGEKLQTWLSLLLVGRTVKIKTRSVDRYGRWLAEVWIDGDGVGVGVNEMVVGKIKEIVEAHHVD